MGEGKTGTPPEGANSKALYYNYPDPLVAWFNGHQDQIAQKASEVCEDFGCPAGDGNLVAGADQAFFTRMNSADPAASRNITPNMAIIRV